MSTKKRLVVGISGASGAIYGIRLLEKLRADPHIETHLVISKAAAMTIHQETDYTVSQVIALADSYYQLEDIGAKIASGSYKTMGMIIAPCSIRSMSEIASGMTTNLLTRAADVMLKERRPLILMVRETPLHFGHLQHLSLLAQVGAIIAPPMPAFYLKPTSIDELIDHSVGRVLDLIGVETENMPRWEGMSASKNA